VLYFGDFDPSGEDMVRSLGERLAFFGVEPEIIKCALTREDIERFNLPPDHTKSTDRRAAGFIATHGDISVELDALPVDALRDRLIEAVEDHMDRQALAATRAVEAREKERLARVLESMEQE